MFRLSSPGLLCQSINFASVHANRYNGRHRLFGSHKSVSLLDNNTESKLRKKSWVTKSRTLVTEKAEDVERFEIWITDCDLNGGSWVPFSVSRRGRLLFGAATILYPIGGCVSLRGRTAPAALAPSGILTHQGDTDLTPQPFWTRPDTA